MPNTEKINLLNLNRTGLEGFFAGLGEKPYRSKQLLQWVHRRGVIDFSEMTDFSRSLRETLSHKACIELPRISTTQLSKDGTRKWLLSVDGAENG